MVSRLYASTRVVDLMHFLWSMKNHSAATREKPTCAAHVGQLGIVHPRTRRIYVPTPRTINEKLLFRNRGQAVIRAPCLWYVTFVPSSPVQNGVCHFARLWILIFSLACRIFRYSAAPFDVLRHQKISSHLFPIKSTPTCRDIIDNLNEALLVP